MLRCSARSDQFAWNQRGANRTQPVTNDLEPDFACTETAPEPDYLHNIGESDELCDLYDAILEIGELGSWRQISAEPAN